MNLRTAARRAVPAAATAAILAAGTACVVQVARPDDYTHLTVLPPSSKSVDHYEPPSTLKAWADDRKWMTAHPVPARPGMTPALVTHGMSDGPCDVLSGNRGWCYAWQVAVITPARVMTLACGGEYAECTSAAYPPRTVRLTFAQENTVPPGTGDYLYIPVSGTVTPGRDVIVIRRHADPDAGRF